MKKLHIGLALVSIVSLMMTGCVTEKTVEEAESPEETTVIEEVAVVDEPVVSLVESLDAVLNTLKEEIISKSSDGEVYLLLDDFVAEQSFEIVCLYYGNEEGDFYVMPKMELPDDYVFSERPIYKNAVDNGTYIAEPYEDLGEERRVQTISKAIYKEDELLGVVGIDVYID